MYNSKNMHQYKAYATANMTVGKTRQVVMLYDGAIRFVQQSIEAISRQDYETRFNQLAKASAIISGMQNSLDHENGGEIAQLLHDYYSSIDARIFSVHRSNDAAVLESIVKELRMMRDVWHEIDRADSAKKHPTETVEPASMQAVPADVSGYNLGVSA